MLIVLAENDMPNRIEQTQLLKSTLKCFGNEDVMLKVMKGGHCEFLHRFNENNINLVGKMIYDFIKERN